MPWSYMMAIYLSNGSSSGDSSSVLSAVAAVATALTCQWLVGPCKVNDVELDDGTVSNCSSSCRESLCACFRAMVITWLYPKIWIQHS
jgi:hypothetical protein